MAAVQLKRVSLSAAERAVAVVWRALEADRLVTPNMTVAPHTGEPVDIQFVFSDGAGAERVARALLHLMPKIDVDTALWPAAMPP